MRRLVLRYHRLISLTAIAVVAAGCHTSYGPQKNLKLTAAGQEQPSKPAAEDASTPSPAPVTPASPATSPTPQPAAGDAPLDIPSAEWRAIAEGVEYREVAWQVEVVQGSLTALRIDLSHARLRVLAASDFGRTLLTARDYARRSGALAVVNGGFFDENERPLGLVIADGKRKSALRHADWGVFYLDRQGAHIVHTDGYSPPENPTQALQCGPRLVVDGRPVSLKPQSARRTAVGIDRQGRVVLVVSSQGALLASELAEILLRPADEGGLACVDAMNLDGGPSSQLCIRSAKINLHLPGGWGVPNALAVFAGE